MSPFVYFHTCTLLFWVYKCTHTVSHGENAVYCDNPDGAVIKVKKLSVERLTLLALSVRHHVIMVNVICPLKKHGSFLKYQKRVGGCRYVMWCMNNHSQKHVKIVFVVIVCTALLKWDKCVNEWAVGSSSLWTMWYIWRWSTLKKHKCTCYKETHCADNLISSLLHKLVLVLFVTK